MSDATERTVPMQGERRLLVAVLEEAIGTFQRYILAVDRRGRTLFVQVEEWFASEDTDSMFSFVAICDALGFQPAYLRLGLRRWRDRHCASLAAGLPPRLADRVRHGAHGHGGR